MDCGGVVGVDLCGWGWVVLEELVIDVFNFVLFEVKLVLCYYWLIDCLGKCVLLFWVFCCFIWNFCCMCVNWCVWWIVLLGCCIVNLGCWLIWVCWCVRRLVIRCIIGLILIVWFLRNWLVCCVRFWVLLINCVMFCFCWVVRYRWFLCMVWLLLVWKSLVVMWILWCLVWLVLLIWCWCWCCCESNCVEKLI